MAAAPATLPTPFVLTNDIPVDLDTDGNVVCPCGETLHTTRALLAAWVDPQEVARDAYRVWNTHLCEVS